MSSMATVMIFGLENSGENSPIILHSLIEMSVGQQGNEEEDGEEGKDEKHIHLQLCDDIRFGKYKKNSPVIIYSMLKMSVCLCNEKEDGEEGEDE